ncbi:MAG: ComF family protein [Ignavibacteria bacterium]|nr:ComF family protein [Ignavibacteria bacterium]
MVYQEKIGFTLNPVKNFLIDCVDFLFPNLCHLCDRKLTRSRFVICEDCISKLTKADQTDLDNFYSEHFTASDIVINFYSKYLFTREGNFQRLVHSLKYNGISKIGIQIGNEIGKDLSKLDWFEKVDFLIPVPLHYIKKIERGYNQSFMICRGINEFTQKPIDTKILKRVRNTKTQTLLSKEERQRNMEGAFVIINHSEIKNKNIAIVDDVCTTGSTSQECLKILFENGAASVSIITSAIA